MAMNANIIMVAIKNRQKGFDKKKNVDKQGRKTNPKDSFWNISC